jgi:hypothetical protein
MRLKRYKKKLIWSIVTIEVLATFTVIFVGIRTYENKVSMKKNNTNSVTKKVEDVQRETNVESTALEENNRNQSENQAEALTSTSIDQPIIQTIDAPRNNLLKEENKTIIKPATTGKIQSSTPSAKKAPAAPVTNSTSTIQEPVSTPVVRETPVAPTEPVTPSAPTVPDPTATPTETGVPSSPPIPQLPSIPTEPDVPTPTEPDPSSTTSDPLTITDQVVE